MREIKEACCCVAAASVSGDEHAWEVATRGAEGNTSSNLADAQPRSFRLPDGSHVRLEGKGLHSVGALNDPPVMGSGSEPRVEALACPAGRFRSACYDVRVRNCL